MFDSIVMRPPKAVWQLALLCAAFAIFDLALNGYFFVDPELPQMWAHLGPGDWGRDREFLLTNTLYNLIGVGLTKLNGGQALTDGQYHAFAVAQSALAVVIVSWASIVKFGVERAAIFLGVLALSSIDFTLLNWLGKSDALLIVTYLAVFFFRRNPFVSAAGFAILVTIHSQQALVIAAAHAIILLLEREWKVSTMAGIAVGVAAGLGANQMYLHAFHVDQVHDRMDYAFGEGRTLNIFKHFIKNAVIAVATALSGVWWLAARYPKDMRSFLLLGAAIAVPLGVSMLTYDYTRVVSMLTLPVVCFLGEAAARNYKEGEGLKLSALFIYGLVALIGLQLSETGVWGAGSSIFERL
jgi:hypothetical protein